MFILVFILSILGCSIKDEASKDEASFISISQDYLVINAEGGEDEIEVKANCLWDVNCNEEWIYVIKGEDCINLSINKNNTYSKRSANIEVYSGEIRKIITVTQNQNFGFSVDKTDIIVKGDGGEIEIPLKTNIENIQIDVPNWINILHTEDARSLSEKRFTFIVDENDTKIERKGEISFSGEGKSVVYNIIQDVINPSQIYSGSRLPDFISKLGRIEIPIFLSPKFASLKNVSVKSSNEYVCDAHIEEGQLVLNVRSTGDANISCYVSENNILECLLYFNILCYDKNNIQIWTKKDDVRGFLAGDDIVIKSNIPLSLFNFYTDTPKLISINGDKITALNAGIAKIIAVEKANQYRFELFPEIVDVRMYNDVYQHFSPYKGIFRLLSNNRIYVFSISLIDHNLNNVLTVYGDQLQSNNNKYVYWEYSYFPLNGLFTEDLQKHSFKCRYAFFKEDGIYEERTVSIPFNER